MRDVYIINPAAGKKDSTEKLTEEIKKVYGDEAKILITKAAGEAQSLAEEEAKTGDEVRIFACGGDGTSFEVLNGIAGYKNAAIGVVPTGSANDFIKYFGFDSKKRFLNIVAQKNGTLLPIDLIKAGVKYCMNQCCAGLDAQVADTMQRYKRLPLVSGSMAYNLAVVRTFLGKIGIQMKVSTDGKLFREGSFLFALCANAPVYGGGYISAPGADITDGELNCVTIDTIKRRQVIGLLPLYKKGEHEKIKECNKGMCKSFEFEAEKEIPVSLDGEIIHTKSFKCKVLEKAKNFALPAEI